MKKKYLWSFLLVVLLLFTVACGKPADDKTKEEEKKSNIMETFGDYTPKMWAITNRENNNKIYLMGSIHIGVKEMYPLPKIIESAFAESKVLAVETNILETEKDMEKALEMLNYLAYTDGSTLSKQIGEEAYDKLAKIGKKYGYNIDYFDYFMPIFHVMYLEEVMVEKTKFSYNYGVDRYFLNKATKDKMKIKDIENSMDIYKAFGNMSAETQKFLIMDFINEYDKTDFNEEANKTVKAWINGDYKAILEDDTNWLEGLSGDDLKAANEFLDILQVKRNVNMADKVIEYLNTDEIHFYIVGAAHFPGDTGILKLLEDRGYEVEEIIQP